MKEKLVQKIAKNKENLENLLKKKKNIEEQIESLQKKIENQEHSLRNLPPEKVEDKETDNAEENREEKL
jgi:peptidoglycan hydrolase CwlO-like protein